MVDREVSPHVRRDGLDSNAALEVAKDESASLRVVELVESGIHEGFALLSGWHEGGRVFLPTGLLLRFCGFGCCGFSARSVIVARGGRHYSVIILGRGSGGRDRRRLRRCILQGSLPRPFLELAEVRFLLLRLLLPDTSQQRCGLLTGLQLLLQLRRQAKERQTLRDPSLGPVEAGGQGFLGFVDLQEPLEDLRFVKRIEVLRDCCVIR